MVTPLEVYEAVRAFLEAGGIVVQILLGVAALLFVVAIARYQVRKRRRINALDDPSPAVSLDRSRRRGV